jgi:ankyrin repeat protein
MDNAVYDKNLKLIEEYLASGVDINSKNKNEDTALSIATELNYSDVIIFLLEKGSDPNTENKIGRTPLFFAILNKNIKIIKKLIKYKSNINHISTKRGYHNANFQTACAVGDVNIVKYLIKKGANINFVDSINCTPLYHASIKNNIEVVKVLLENGVEIDNMSVTESSRLGYCDIVKLLLERGYDIKNDIFSLEHATYDGHMNIVKLLLQYGVNVENNALEIASYNGYLDIVKELLKYGANIKYIENYQFGFNKCALVGASENNYYEIVKLLLECTNVNINYKDINSCHTALLGALKYNNMRVVNLLIQHGANINVLSEEEQNIYGNIIIENKKIKLNYFTK